MEKLMAIFGYVRAKEHAALKAKVREYFIIYANVKKQPGWCLRVDTCKAELMSMIK